MDHIVSFWQPNIFFKTLKLQLTPKLFLPLMKTTNFPYHFSEKIISIDKILPILQAFKVVISCPTTKLGGIWVGPPLTSSGLSCDVWLGFLALWKHIWGICASYFVINGQDFWMKEVYHLAIQLGVLLRLARLRCIQLFRNRSRLSNETERDIAETYYRYWGFLVLDSGFMGFNDIEGKSTNRWVYAYLSFLVGKTPWTSKNRWTLSTPQRFCGTTFVETAVYRLLYKIFDFEVQVASRVRQSLRQFAGSFGL